MANSPSSTNDPDETAQRGFLMLTREDLSNRWKVSIPTIKRLEKDGESGYPTPIRIGARLIRYRESDVLTYEKTRQLA